MMGCIERCQCSDENLPGREPFQEVVDALEGTRSLRRHLAQGYVATRITTEQCQFECKRECEVIVGHVTVVRFYAFLDFRCEVPILAS